MRCLVLEDDNLVSYLIPFVNFVPRPSSFISRSLALIDLLIKFLFHFFLTEIR